VTAERVYLGVYLILSLKWSDGLDRLNWWGPDNSGYCYDIDKAGRYTGEQIAANPDYYDNEETTRAVRVDDVYAEKLGPIQKVVRASYRRPRKVHECHSCLGEFSIHPEVSPITCEHCGAYTCEICYDAGICVEGAVRGRPITTETRA